MNEMVKEELEKFKVIAENDDYELLISDDIKFHDFIRLDYIVSALGFDNLEVYFFLKHCNKFEERMRYLDKLEEEYKGCTNYIDLEEYEEWIKPYEK